MGAKLNPLIGYLVELYCGTCGTRTVFTQVNDITECTQCDTVVMP